MFKRILLAAALLAAVPAASAGAHTPPRAQASIVGGHAAPVANWPSIAYLLAGWDSDGDGQIDQAASCTGSVIAPRWIISAAHCAFQPNGEPVDAMVSVTGVQDVNDPKGEAIGADQLVVDPDWDPQALHGDALLVHLKSASSRPAMTLATPGGQYVTKTGVPNAAGWGTTDEASTVSTDILQEAYLALQDDDTCAAFAPGYDPGTQTCAGTPNTAGACHGDSGGPLIVFDKATGKPVLWGLTSFGPQLDLGMKPCELHAPAIYSWVPGFASFIADTLGASPAPAPAPTPTPTATPRPTPRPTPSGPVITPPADHVAPQLTHARLSPKRFHGATRLSFDLSEAAAVRLTVVTASGRAAGAAAPIAAPAGHTAKQLSGRWAGRKLKPGRYKLRISAVDTAGNAAPLQTLSFTVTR
jgi:secreted trypsin-like serine protease